MEPSSARVSSAVPAYSRLRLALRRNLKAGRETGVLSNYLSVRSTPADVNVSCDCGKFKETHRELFVDGAGQARKGFGRFPDHRNYREAESRCHIARGAPPSSQRLEKAKEGCFISNSIKAAVKLEPEISAGEAQPTAEPAPRTEPDQ